MRILAVIPARGGSKRVPGKNVRLLGERPLIVWSIETAKNNPDICDILISTDDAAIAEVARKANTLVPWLRPASLATDHASSLDVCLHALDWYESQNGEIDGLLLLQPTSPFRSQNTIRSGIELFRANERRSVVGVSSARSHPMWCFRIENQSLRPFVAEVDPNLRSQDLPPAYVINGAFYLIAPRELRQLRSFVGEDTIPLLLNEPAESLDIDNEWDWKVAEALLSIRSAGSNE